MVIQWANTAPEKFYLILKKRNSFKLNKNFWGSKIKKIIYTPLNFLLGVHSNNKNSLAQGNSDYVLVINKYTKTILVKQGVNEKKIYIVGLLNYDNALKIKKCSKKKIKQNFNLLNYDIIISYYSQPFYKKDIRRISLQKQIEFVNKLYLELKSFYKKRKKSFCFIIKLHPVENLEDYNSFSQKSNIIVLKNVQNPKIIYISNFCIGFHSTILQSIIVLDKPIISLAIIKKLAKIIKFRAKILGLSYSIESWKEFREELKKLEKKEYKSLNNINYNKIIKDGNCYKRNVKLIKNSIKKK